MFAFFQHNLILPTSLSRTTNNGSHGENIKARQNSILEITSTRSSKFPIGR